MRWRGASSSLPPSILIFIHWLFPYITHPPPSPLRNSHWFFYAVEGGSASVPPSLKDQTLLSSITSLVVLIFNTMEGGECKPSSFSPYILLLSFFSPFITHRPPPPSTTPLIFLRGREWKRVFSPFILLLLFFYPSPYFLLLFIFYCILPKTNFCDYAKSGFNFTIIPDPYPS